MSTGRYSYGTSLCYWSDVQYSQKVLTHQVMAKPWFCRLQQMRFGRRVTTPCCGNAAVDRWVITFWPYCILWCFKFSLSANSRTFQGLYQKFKYFQGFLKNEGLSKTTSKIQGHFKVVWTMSLGLTAGSNKTKQWSGSWQFYLASWKE